MRDRGSYSISSAARIIGVSRAKVRGWVRTGELPAVDLRAAGADRPTVRILGTAIAEFLRTRQVDPTATVTRRPDRLIAPRPYSAAMEGP